MSTAVPIPPRHRSAAPDKLLLGEILKQVSRSFYLSLVILPKTVRPQVSLAYLFCRAADTIADTALFPPQQRQQALTLFRQQFLGEAPPLAALAPLQAMMCPHQGSAGERQLFAHLADCLRLLDRLATSDQRLIRELVLTLTQGMAMDLTYFPGDQVTTARALPDLATLDLYTYYVAGVVGAFWTNIHGAHSAVWQRHASPDLCALGVRFGKGLQLTNILKDIGKDLQHGRCYLPLSALEPLALRVTDLSQPEVLPRLRPLLHQLIQLTLDHLDHACTYVLHLPRQAWRARLSCMWPLLFAVQTLHVVWQADGLLEAQTRVKMSRYAIYRTLFWSLWCLPAPGLLQRYYRRLRQRLTDALAAGA